MVSEKDSKKTLPSEEIHNTHNIPREIANASNKFVVSSSPNFSNFCLIFAREIENHAVPATIVRGINTPTRTCVSKNSTGKILKIEYIVAFLNAVAYFFSTDSLAISLSVEDRSREKKFFKISSFITF